MITRIYEGANQIPGVVTVYPLRCGPPQRRIQSGGSLVGHIPECPPAALARRFHLRQQRRYPAGVSRAEFPLARAKEHGGAVDEVVETTPRRAGRGR
jgi:hypothetical protein